MLSVASRQADLIRYAPSPTPHASLDTLMPAFPAFMFLLLMGLLVWCGFGLGICLHRITVASVPACTCNNTSSGLHWALHWGSLGLSQSSQQPSEGSSVILVYRWENTQETSNFPRMHCYPPREYRHQEISAQNPALTLTCSHLAFFWLLSDESSSLSWQTENSWQEGVCLKVVSLWLHHLSSKNTGSENYIKENGK